MAKVVAEITMSLDGYVAGPNQTLEEPLGRGGEKLHEWVVRLKSWREPHGLEGGDIGPDDELQLDVTIDEDRLLVSVTDTGSGFTPPEPNLDDESGWGLFIVDRLSHRWGVERRGGTRVWFEMGLPAREPHGEPTADGGAADEASAEEPGPRRRATLGIRVRPQAS
jgi:hypothetical protein